mmetsp:Transcript_12387/g.18636  ORF Transcript_12387/g.18636 Transcript_12387/m.18636 type:complete len:231 (+) Transcript_12387:193-885(+)
MRAMHHLHPPYHAERGIECESHRPGREVRRNHESEIGSHPDREKVKVEIEITMTIALIQKLIKIQTRITIGGVVVKRNILGKRRDTGGTMIREVKESLKVAVMTTTMAMVVIEDLETVIGRENQSLHVKIRNEAEIEIDKEAVGGDIAVKTIQVAPTIVILVVGHLPREIRNQNEIRRTPKKEERRTKEIGVEIPTRLSEAKESLLLLLRKYLLVSMVSFEILTSFHPQR